MALSTDFTPLSLAVLPRRKRHPVVRALRALLGTAAVLAAVGGAGWAIISQPGVQPIAPPQAVQGLIGNPDARSAQADRLQAHVKALSEDLPGRSFDQPAQLQRAADYVFAQMQQTGTQPIRQAFEVDGNRYENIVLRLGPAAGTPAGNAPLLVIGAHLDAARTGDVDPATGPNATSHTPGADDNASGVAGLLELARLLAQQAPSQPIELVAYTLEEPPQFRTRDMGSYRHAQGLAQRKQAVRLMLSLEMIGYYSDAPGSQRYPLQLLEWIYPTQGNFLGLIGQLGDFGAMREAKALMRGALAVQPSDAPPLPIHSLNAPKQVHGVDFSDHLNYWQFGFPALMVTDTSFMRNPHYHQPTDTWATLDYTRMAQAVNAVLGVALAAPAAPRKTADIDPR